MIPVLRSGDLVLRPVGPADLDALRALLVEPEVRRHLCDDRVPSREEVAALLDDHRARAPLGLWVILGDGGAVIGAAGLGPVPPATSPDLAGEAEPLIALHPAHWGRGHARAALLALAEHAASLGLPRLVAFADIPNSRSRRMLEAAGFVPLGGLHGPHGTLLAYERRQDVGEGGVRAPSRDARN